MNNIFKVLFCALLVQISSAAIRNGDQSDWPEFEIRPTAQWTLKELFDSGLRPYRFPGIERSLLEQKHLKAVIVQSNGIRLPQFSAETVEINVQAGGLLSSLVFVNVPMTLIDSRNEMLRWLKFGKDPVRTEAQLEDFLKTVEHDYRGYDYGTNGIRHNFSINWRDESGVRYGIWFQQARHPMTALALRMQIGFPLTPRQEGASYGIPIPPPPGYENVDMTAPKDFGPDRPPDDPEIERVRKAGVMPDYSTLPPESKVNSGALAPRDTLTRPVKTTPSRPLWIWWLGAGGLIGVVIIAYTLRRLLR